MNSTIITDASCLILLDKINGLFILHKLYSNIVTTPEIASEYGNSLPDWIKVKSVINIARFEGYANLVDQGEASAIALAFEVVDPILILDDLEARKLAERLQLEYKGTIGVLVSAKQNGIISSLKSYFDKVEATDFRISPLLLKTLLEQYDK